ncbi:MAG: phenylacetate--CoA ligase family protein [Gemmatimonadales bacterium]
MTDRLDVRLRRGLIRAYEGAWHRRPVFPYWNALEASQWWAPARLAALQLERLQALLQRTQATSPWYREQWRAAGLDAAEVTSLAAFRRWPVIDRDTIRHHRVAMRSTTPGTRLIAKATGGSSGVPLQFDLDFDSNDRRMAAWHRGYGWAGAAPGTRQWYLWGVPPSSAAEWKKKKVRLYDRLYRRHTESCFDLSEANLPRFVDSLARTRPDAIVAYTNALYTFARMLEERGITPYRPHSLVVGAEKLHGYQRTTIERVFGAPVFETYGSREFMLIGAECELHQGLHLTAEQLLVEILDDDGHPVPEGEAGNVTITDLTNYGMPFIRYANGDRAIAGGTTCGCGRGLPLLREVTGRRLDVLTTPDGRSLPGEFFPHILKELASVRQFQVIQDDPAAITVRLVAPEWRESDEQWLRREVAATAGGALRLDLERVTEIPLTAAGKLQVVVNRLATASTAKEQV